MSLSINSSSFGMTSLQVFGQSTESFDALKAEDPNLASEVPRILAAFSSIDCKGKVTADDLNKIGHHLSVLENKLRTSNSPNAELLGQIADKLEDLQEEYEPICRSIVEGTSVDESTEKLKEAIELLIGMSKSIDSLDELAQVMAMLSVLGGHLVPSQLNSISESVTDFASLSIEKMDSPEEKVKFLQTVIKMVEAVPVDIDTTQLEEMLDSAQQELKDSATVDTSAQAQGSDRTPDFIVTGAPDTFLGGAIHLGGGGAPEQVHGIDAPLGQNGPIPVSLQDLVYGTAKAQNAAIKVTPLNAQKHDDQYWIAEVEKSGNAWLNEAREEVGRKFAADFFSAMNDEMQGLAQSLTENAMENFPGLEGIEL